MIDFDRLDLRCRTSSHHTRDQLLHQSYASPPDVAGPARGAVPVGALANTNTCWDRAQGDASQEQVLHSHGQGAGVSARWAWD